MVVRRIDMMKRGCKGRICRGGTSNFVRKRSIYGDVVVKVMGVPHGGWDGGGGELLRICICDLEQQGGELNALDR